VLVLLPACTGVGNEPVPGTAPHHVPGGFRNTNPEFQRPDGWTRAKFWVSRSWASSVEPRSFDAPRVANDASALRDGVAGPGHPAPTITWVGHSTVLIQLEGVSFLTDPQWSERASPFSFAGPKRVTSPGLRFEDLPPIHFVVVSHDHYDHLDVATVKRLWAAHRPQFLVPLGLKAWFTELGIDGVEELDWWESRMVRVVMVRVDGRPAAFNLCVVHGGRMWLIDHGADTSLLPARPNNLIYRSIIRDAFREGLEEVDLGVVPEGNRSLERFKRGLGGLPHHRACAIRTNALFRASYRVGELAPMRRWRGA